MQFQWRPGSGGGGGSLFVLRIIFVLIFSLNSCDTHEIGLIFLIFSRKGFIIVSLGLGIGWAFSFIHELTVAKQFKAFYRRPSGG